MAHVMSKSYHEQINMEGIDWELTKLVLRGMFSEDMAVL